MSAAVWETATEAYPTSGTGAAALPGRVPSPARMPRPRHLSLVPAPDESQAERAGSSGRLVLTRRGRLVLAVLGALVAALVAAFVLAGASAADTVPHAVTVQPGETLSEIAVRELPDVAIRAGVIELIAANHLRSDQVTAGQVLTIPAH